MGTTGTLPTPGLDARGGLPGRIDVHHHFNAPGGRGGQATWTPARAVDEMDAAEVAVGIGWPGPVSVSQGAGGGAGGGAGAVDALRDRARLINEFGADVVRRYPTRFGLFASLPPLADVDGALREIDYAYGTLKADGIGLVTHHENRWLGDPMFIPVLQELNRREAVVFVHPQGHAAGCACGTLTYQTENVTAAWLEYPFNTARTILNLMTTGSLRAFPNIRFIFCHGGGAFTSMLQRIEGFTGWFDTGPETMQTMFPEGLRAEFARLHFECAQALAPEFMTMLRSMVPSTQLLFGTDYDRFPLTHSVERLQQLALPQEELAAIEYGNARRLLKR